MESKKNVTYYLEKLYLSQNNLAEDVGKETPHLTVWKYFVRSFSTPFFLKKIHRDCRRRKRWLTN